jgi:hypothetical protein
LLGGLAWLVIFYVSQGSLPLASLGTGNLLIGATFFVGGIVFVIVGIVLWAISRGSTKAT